MGVRVRIGGKLFSHSVLVVESTIRHNLQSSLPRYFFRHLEGLPCIVVAPRWAFIGRKQEAGILVKDIPNIFLLSFYFDKLLVCFPSISHSGAQAIDISVDFLHVGSHPIHNRDVRHLQAVELPYAVSDSPIGNALHVKVNRCYDGIGVAFNFGYWLIHKALSAVKAQPLLLLAHCGFACSVLLQLVGIALRAGVRNLYYLLLCFELDGEVGLQEKDVLAEVSLVVVGALARIPFVLDGDLVALALLALRRNPIFVEAVFDRLDACVEHSYAPFLADLVF